MLYIHRWVTLKDEALLGIQTHDTISLKKNCFCSWVAKMKKNKLRCGSERDDHWWPCYWHTPNQWDMPNTKFSRTLIGLLLLEFCIKDPSNITYPVGSNCRRSSTRCIPAFETRNPMGPNQNLRGMPKGAVSEGKKELFKCIWGISHTNMPWYLYI